MKKKKLFQILISILVAVGCFYYVGREIEWVKFKTTLQNARLEFFIASVLALLVSFMFRIVRWKLILLSIKNIPTRRLCSPMFIGFMANILPARAGEFLRALVLKKRENVPFTTGFGTIFIERIFDMMAVLFLMTLVLLFGDISSARSGDNLAKLIHQLGTAAAGGFVILGIFAWVIYRYPVKIKNTVVTILSVFSKKIAGKAGKLVLVFSDGFAAIKTLSVFIRVAVLSVTVWGLAGVSFFILLYAFPGGIPASPVSAAGLLLLATMAATFIPAPGYLGPYQLACVMVLSDHYGFTREIGMGYGLLNWTAGMVPVILIGFFFLYRENISITEIDEMKDGEKSL